VERGTEKELDNCAKVCHNCYMGRRKTRASMTDVLRQAIAGSEMSFKALERATGVKRQSLMKFARGEQSLRLDLADKLAAYFGIECRRVRRRCSRMDRGNGGGL